MQRRRRKMRTHRKFRRAPVLGGPWRLRQLRQFDFGFQHEVEIEDQTVLRLVVPLPGIDRESLSIKAKEQLVTISASIREDLADFATRPDDSWDIVLEQSVIPESAKAKYVEGVLIVDFRLKDPSKPIDDITYE